MHQRLFILTILFFLLMGTQPLVAQCDFEVAIGIDPMADGNVYCPGDTVKLSAGAFDSYQWYYSFSNTNTGGTAIDGATSELYLVDISYWGFAYFYVVATKNGCSEASPAVLIDSWAFLSPVIASDGQSEFCNGDSTEIYVPFGGYVNFQWYQDGEPIAGATESNFWVRESGTYVIFASPAVCPEIVLNSGVGPTFTFLGPAVPVITQQGTTLISSSGPAFQWLLNGQTIPGATAGTYTPVENGTYTVRVSDNSGCTVFSAPFLFTITGIGETSPLEDLKIYPTPAWASVWIDPGKLNVLEVRVFDLSGKLYLSETAPPTGVFSLNLYEMPSGWYWCALQTENGVIYRQIVKQ
ncbi:MAG: T9SS type A sorting domain-containing protein [Saprospiraceae bacterium]|nr:T9SS type A sorting domain-containing protein [Saprospiraceae bacterium]